MKSNRSTSVASAALAVVCAISSVVCLAQMSPQTSPDNSNANSSHQKTADDQPNDSNDPAITAKVRKAIMADKSLSTYAHNIKIITMNGKVSLKGPVQSEEEKQRIVS